MKKIMFDDRLGLTQAVLEGRKTMTRRVVPPRIINKIPSFQQEYYEASLDCISEKEAVAQMPLYEPGEVVSVAQSYHTILEEMFDKDKGYQNPIYNPFRSQKPNLEEEFGWRNKMYVRADLMPHRIRITGIKVERLQDISDEDCMKEGIRKLESSDIPTHFTFDGWMFNNRVFRCADTPREAFSALFNKLSGKGAWDKNPWVFAYEFELYRF